MTVLLLILLIVSLVCLLVATVIGYAVAHVDQPVSPYHRVNWLALGLAFYVAVQLLQGLVH